MKRAGGRPLAVMLVGGEVEAPTRGAKECNYQWVEGTDAIYPLARPDLEWGKLHKDEQIRLVTDS